MKATDDWRKVVQAVMGLWPDTHKRHWSPHVENAWRQRLGHLPLDQILSSLTNHATEKPFFPKAGEIAKTISVKREGNPRGHAEAVTREQERKEYEIDLRSAKEFYATIPRKEKLQHQQAAAKQDWRLEWSLAFSVDHPAWRSIIISRVKRGIKPDDPDPERIVPKRPQRQANNLGLTTDLPQQEPLAFDSEGYPEI